MRLKRLWAIGASAALLFALQVPGSATAVQTFTLGVDHFDPPNQEIDQSTGMPKDGGKIFEYTDFFTRALSVHQGDTIDFHVAIADHLVTVAADEATARQQFPLAYPDSDDPNAIATNAPKIGLGPAAFAGFGGPPESCGGSADTACNFDGTNAPTTAFPGGFDSNWFVTINAASGHSYPYFCHFHPGMRGVVTVVGAGDPTQSQGDINAAAGPQFDADKAEAEAAYAAAQTPVYTGGAPGTRNYHVHVGLTTDDRHVAIHDMVPDKLHLVSGDTVQYDWQFNVIHTVGFTNAGPPLPGPFGADCNPKYVPLTGPSVPPCTEIENGPEFIADPGTRKSGAVLNMKHGADSGLLVGADYDPFYGLQEPTSWSVKTSQPGTYAYHCTVHDWMTGTLAVIGS